MEEKLSVSTKIILFVLVTILISTPFYEFIPVLDPDNSYSWYSISCFHNY